MVYSVEHRILIQNFYKLKNYSAKNLLENFLAKVGRYPVQMSCKEYWETLAVWQLDKALSKPATSHVRALMTCNVDSVYELSSSREHTPKSHRTTRQISQKNKNSWLTNVTLYRSVMN